MGIVRWMILAAMSLFALIMILNYLGAFGSDGGAKDATQYHCPMHPSYISNQPGECPICGMNLVPIPKQAEGDAGHSMAMEMDSTVPAGLTPLTIEPRRQQLIGIRTALVERQNLADRIMVAGYLSADETTLARIQVRFSGWVTKLFVDQTGQQVAKGQALFSVYSPDLYQAEQDYILALRAVDEKNGDSLMRATRAAIFQAAKTRLDLLGVPSAELSRLDSTLNPSSTMTLRSSFAGVVMEKSLVTGQYVDPTQTLLAIADLNTIWALVDVYEQDIHSISLGQSAQMRLTAYPGEVFDGKIDFIYPSVSDQTRTLPVRIAFANPDQRLRPGMYAEIELSSDSAAVVAVPESAVIDAGGEQYVFMVHGDTHFQPRLIATGRRTGDLVEVLSGLSEGDRVVTSANFLIDSESRLKAAISGMSGGGAAMPDEHKH